MLLTIIVISQNRLSFSNHVNAQYHDPSVTKDDESVIYSLSRWREREGVRVDRIMIFPLTLILSPGGEEKFIIYSTLSKKPLHPRQHL
jgi:hypothetical protein